MRLKNLKISNQINMSLVLIIVLVLGLGYISLVDSNSLWKNAKSLYENPLTVQNALSKIKTNVFGIRIEMKEIVLDTEEEDSSDHISTINNLESDIFRQIDILNKSYLGDAKDIDDTYNSLLQWRSIRDETIRLVLEGRHSEATPRSKNSGVGVIQAEKVISELSIIDDFAQNKGVELYVGAQQNRDSNIRMLVTVLILIVILSIIVVLLLRNSLLSPLKELTAVTDAIEHGNIDARSNNTSTNEFGILAKSFNSMIETVKTDIDVKDRISKVSKTMFQQDDLHMFCKELIGSLLEQTESQVGAVYLLDENDNKYKHFESIGLSEESYAEFSSISSDGEFGSALLSGKVQHLTEIPADSQITFNAVSGNFKVKEIITIPIIRNLKIVAVISIANIKNYSSGSLLLIENLLNEINARFSSIMSSEEIKEFSDNLNSTNLELKQQTKEMELQKDEMSEQNIELEIQKKQLTEASQLKSSFLSNMSHELRTPLNSVISLASVLNRRLEDKIPADEYSYIEVIERNGKNLLHLVNDLLDLSRIESGKEEIELSKFNLNSIVREQVEMMGSQAHSKGIQIKNQIAKDIPDIISDRIKCRHIFQNIISNALKFTDEGEINISSVVDKNEISIIVTDTGIGISPEAQEFIFEEFRQADETPSRKKGGTGLGLAIAKKYTELMGGSITVESVIGKGSVFTIKLPLIMSKAGTNKAFEFEGNIRSAEKLRDGFTKGKSILLVEDSEPAIIQTTDILREQGYKVVVAKNGIEALKQLETMQPDGMMLDLMMPEMDGFQVLKSIRDEDKYAHIPVLILTAKHITKDELSFFKSNHVYQLIQKGAIDKHELLRSVGNLVKGQLDKKAKDDKNTNRIENEKPTVLVIEDNADNMIITKLFLGDGYEIIEAADGKSGVDKAIKYKPNLILMDISLPGMNGFEAFSEIRNITELSNVPIIALTASAMAGNKEEILDYGFDGYISKPIDENEMNKVIMRSLYENK